MADTIPATVPAIAGIEIEAVIGGALMRVTFVAGTNPAQVPALLRELDPSAQFRDAFPTRGNGGSRATQSAKVLVITVEGRGDSIFIKLTATTKEGDDLSISVPKKKSGDFLPDLEKLGKLSEKSLGKLKMAVESKKAATVILPDAEQIGVAYWKADDGSAYADSLTAEVPV